MRRGSKIYLLLYSIALRTLLLSSLSMYNGKMGVIERCIET